METYIYMYIVRFIYIRIIFPYSLRTTSKKLWVISMHSEMSEALVGIKGATTRLIPVEKLMCQT